MFVDARQTLDQAWHELQLWLWFVFHGATDGTGAASNDTAAPPVLLVATKWARKGFDEEELDTRIEELMDMLPRLRDQLQRGPGPSDCRSKWLFPVENFAEDVDGYIRPLRERLHALSTELLLPQPPRTDVVNAKPHAGLQSQLYPVAWLRAHDLLTELGGGKNAKSPKEQLEAQAYEALGSRMDLTTGFKFNLTSNQEMQTFSGEKMVAPKGACVEVLRIDRNSTTLDVNVSCTSLGLSQVRELLEGLRPTPISGTEVLHVLRLLHSLGTLLWFQEKGLEEHVLLDIGKVGVALAKVISLRFWAESRLQHSEHYKQGLRKSAARVPKTTLRRLHTDGVATRELLNELWRGDFAPGEAEAMTAILLKTMEQKGLLLRRAFENEFVVPCCLPKVAMMPESPQKNGEVCYMDMRGLVSPTILAKIAAQVCEQVRVSCGTGKLSPGPPQIFRNHVELRSETAVASLTQPSVEGTQLLKIRVQPSSFSLEPDEDTEETRVLSVEDIVDYFFAALGMDRKEERSIKVYARQHIPYDPEVFFSACGQKDCYPANSRCWRCQLLQERFLPDLSDKLRDVVRRVSFQGDVRPAGSFKFKSTSFPCDVDLEEYVVLSTDDEAAALSHLAGRLQEICKRCSQLGADILWAGLKAGRSNPASDAKDAKFLTWTTEDISKGSKPRCSQDAQTRISLSEALKEGNKSRSAFISIFAKINLFKNQASAPRFFEVTNVIRFGYMCGSQIKPVTGECDFLSVVEEQLEGYCGPTPKAVKYAGASSCQSALVGFRTLPDTVSLL